MTFARDIAMAPFAKLTVAIIGSIFRGEANGDCHSKQQRLEPVMFGQPIDEEDQWNHHQNELDHKPGETVDAAIKSGGHALARDLVSKFSKEGMATGPRRDASRIPADDIGAHEAQVGQIKGAVGALLAGMRKLFRRHCFTGQRRLIDEQVFRHEEPQIGGDHVQHHREPESPLALPRGRHLHLLNDA